MHDWRVRMLLTLYPEEFRERYGPQIEADLFHPDTSVSFAVVDIIRSAIYLRLTTPGLYVWAGAFLLAGLLVGFSIPWITLQAVRVVNPKLDSQVAFWALMFVALMLPLFGTLFAAVHWLQTYQRSRRQCSKPRTSRNVSVA